jgi:hypothetical protein
MGASPKLAPRSIAFCNSCVIYEARAHEGSLLSAGPRGEPD